MSKEFVIVERGGQKRTLVGAYTRGIDKIYNDPQGNIAFMAMLKKSLKTELSSVKDLQNDADLQQELDILERAETLRLEVAFLYGKWNQVESILGGESKEATRRWLSGIS